MKNHPYRLLGFWSASFTALLGLIYMGLLIYSFASAGLSYPLWPSVQLAGGIITFLTATALVVLFTAICYSSSADKRVYGSLGVSFISLFAISVCINRFVQLTVIQQAGSATADLQRFLPYDTGSVMFALEMLGWGFFSSLAALSVAPLFPSTRLERSICVLFVIYALISLTSLVGYATTSPLLALGFIAWGPILTVITILLAIYFRPPKIINPLDPG